LCPCAGAEARGAGARDGQPVEGEQVAALPRSGDNDGARDSDSRAISSD